MSILDTHEFLCLVQGRSLHWWKFQVLGKDKTVYDLFKLDQIDFPWECDIVSGNLVAL